MKWVIIGILFTFITGCVGSRPMRTTRGFRIERLQGAFPIHIIAYNSPERMKSDIEAKTQDELEKETERRMLPLGGMLEIGSTTTTFDRIKIVDEGGRSIFNCLEVDFKDEVVTSNLSVVGAPYQDKETFMMKCPITVAVPGSFRIRIIEVDREIGEFRVSKAK